MAINDSIESLKNFVNDAAQAAAKYTKSAASIAKANFNILAEQDKQKKAYLELGKLYYRDFITGEEPDDAEYLPLVERISETVKAIEELKASIEDAKDDFAPAEPAEAEEAAEVVEETCEKAADAVEEACEKAAEAVEEAAEQTKEVVVEVVDDVAQDVEEAKEEADKPAEE